MPTVTPTGWPAPSGDAFRRQPRRARQILLGLAVATSALTYGFWKAVEPGGGLFVHAAYLSRVAMQLAPCMPLPAAPLGKPRVLSACLSFNGNNPDLLEWLAFHRMQGVARFDVFWDVIGAYNQSRHANFLAALRHVLHDNGGDVYAWRKSDFGLLADQIIAAAAAARGGSNICSPTAADIEELRAQVRTCLSPGTTLDSTWQCQSTMGALCVAAAKVRGDDWLGLFDVDEFFFAPGRPGREEACFWGGAPGRVSSGTHSAPQDCIVPQAEAPLRTGRDLPSVLRRYSLLASSVVVEGVVFGMVNNYTREGLMLEAHGRAALMDADGYLLPPRGFTRDTCPDWFCRLMTPKKSFIRVAHAPLAGLRIHHHDTGPFAVERPTLGAWLRLNHYAFDDIASVEKRGNRPVYFDGVNHYKPLVENRNGIVDFLSAAPDESGRALVPLLRHCMESPKHANSDTCRPA